MLGGQTDTWWLSHPSGKYAPQIVIIIDHPRVDITNQPKWRLLFRCCSLFLESCWLTIGPAGHDFDTDQWELKHWVWQRRLKPFRSVHHGKYSTHLNEPSKWVEYVEYKYHVCKPAVFAIMVSLPPNGRETQMSVMQLSKNHPQAGSFKKKTHFTTNKTKKVANIFKSLTKRLSNSSQIR